MSVSNIQKHLASVMGVSLTKNKNRRGKSIKIIETHGAGSRCSTYARRHLEKTKLQILVFINTGVTLKNLTLKTN